MDELVMNEAASNQVDLANKIEDLQKDKPLLEQEHKLVVGNISVCDLAQDYQANQDGRSSRLMSEHYDTICKLILDTADIELQGKDKRKPAKLIVNIGKHNCGCIPLRRMNKIRAQRLERII